MSNIFASINFLFLLALATISWVILCYFKHIEDQRAEDFNFEFQLEHPIASDDAYLDDLDVEMAKPGSDTFDICLNFVCIFACIYMLTKLTQASERYVAKFMQDKMQKATSARYNRWPYMSGEHHMPQQQPERPQTQQGQPPQSQTQPQPQPTASPQYGATAKQPSDHFSFQSMESYRSKQAALEEHIVFMEQQNAELKKQLRHLNNVVAMNAAAQVRRDQARHQCLKLALNEFAVVEHSRLRERLAYHKADQPNKNVDNGTNNIQPPAFSIEKPIPVQIAMPKIMGQQTAGPMSTMRFSTLMPENCAINFEAKPVGGELVEPDSTDLLSERFVWHC